MAGKFPNPRFNMSDWGGECPREDKYWKYGVPPVRMRMIPSP